MIFIRKLFSIALSLSFLVLTSFLGGVSITIEVTFGKSRFIASWLNAISLTRTATFLGLVLTGHTHITFPLKHFGDSFLVKLFNQNTLIVFHVPAAC